MSELINIGMYIAQEMWEQLLFCVSLNKTKYFMAYFQGSL